MSVVLIKFKDGSLLKKLILYTDEDQDWIGLYAEINVGRCSINSVQKLSRTNIFFKNSFDSLLFV